MNQQKPANRRAVLWNVEIPGDPYDIRKSMIARLPEHPARFMGENLELVCLFQAAQIERLAQYLDEMTLQMRSLERIQLDRHSYEVQIKELAQKLQLFNQSKEENNKLRDFIKGQSEELQNLQRYRNSAQSLIEVQKKYESVLNELRLTRDNYEALHKTSSDSLSELADLKYRYERLQAVLGQERVSKQREIKFSIQKSIAETKNIYESREYQLKGELTVMKENLMLKNQEINLEKQKNQQLLRQLNQKQELIGKYMRGEIETQSSTKTQEFLRISKRLEQSTYLLEQKQKSIINYKDQISYLTKRSKQLQEDLRKRQQELKRKEEQRLRRETELKNATLEYNNNPQLLIKIAEYQKKLIIFSSEVQRLKESVSIREKEIVERQKQFAFYKEKSFVYEKNIEALNRDLNERENLIKRMEFEVKMVDNRDGKIEAFGLQVSRLNGILREKLNDITKLENRINELAQTEAHHLTLIRTKQQALRILQSRTKQYETKLNDCEESNKLKFDQINLLTLKLTTCQNTNIQLRRQIDSKPQVNAGEQNQIKIQINTLTQETSQLKVQLNYLSQQINQKHIQNKNLREDNQKMFLEINQFQRKILTYENMINELRITNSQKLTDKQHHFEQLQASFRDKQRAYIEKIQMYSKSVPKMSQQIQRLHQLLEKRGAELKRVQDELQMEKERARMHERRKSTDFEIKILEFEKNIAFYQSKCKNYEKINKELEEDKTKVSDRIISLENKLRDSHMELEKIISTLKTKEISTEDYEKRAALLQATISQLREENLRLQSESLKTRQELELNLDIIKKLNYELDVHKRDLSVSISNCSNLKEEYSKLRQAFEEKEFQKPGLKHTIDELNHKLAKLQNQVSYLSQQLDQKKTRILAQQQELRQAKFSISEYQDSIKHANHSNAAKLEQMRQKMLSEFDLHLKKEAFRYQQLQQAYSELEMNYQNKSVYFEDQSGKIQGQQGQIEDLRTRIQALQTQDTELRRHLDDYQQKVFLYEERFALISQEIQRLTMENNTFKSKNVSLSQELEKQKEESHSLRIKIEQISHSWTQSNTRAIAQINEELSRTKIQLTNLKQKVKEYESRNQHTIAERDELFKISHEQQQRIKQYERELIALRGFQGSSYELHLVKEQYTIVHNQYNILQQEFNRLTSELEQARRRLAENVSSNNAQKEHQIRELEIKIRQITQDYENALRISQQTIKDYQKNNYEFQQQIHGFEQRVYGYEQKIQGYEQRISQYDQILQKHIRTINTLQSQNSQLKGRLSEIQHKLISQKEISQIQELKTQYINIKLENQELNRVLEEMQEQLFEANQDRKRLNAQISEMTHSLNHFQAQNSELAQMQAENAHLKHTIEQQRAAIETLRQKLSLLSTQIDQIRSEAEIKIQSLNSHYASLSSSHISLEQEKISLKQQIESLQLEITQVSVYQQISQELQAKYNALYTAYEETYKVYNEMKIQAETVRVNLNNAEMRIALLNEQFDKINLMVVNLRNQLIEVRAQNERLKQQLSLRQTQWTKIVSTNADLEAELKRMYQLNEDLTKQLKETRLKLTDDHALEQKIKHHMFLFVMMCAEVESLRKRVVETEQECEEVRRKSISPIKPKK